MIKNTFSNPIAFMDSPTPTVDADFVLHVNKEKELSYLVIREVIEEGQHIRGFSVLADDQVIYESQCIGHKRIVSLNGIKAETLTLRITVAAQGWSLRDIVIY